MNEKVIVLDFGGQYAQLIARRVREAGVYCEILPSTVKTEVLRQMPELKGIIFTGGPASVYEPDSPDCDKDVYNIGVPVLGICYGAQLIIKHFGGRVEHTEKGEYGKKEAVFEKCRIFDGVAASQIWMSHRDQVVSLPEGFKAICHTDGCPISAYTSGDERIVGLQFHPEVVHTVDGKRMMENFLVKVCGCKCDWSPGNLIDEYIADIKKTVGSGRVISGISGGVDSSVASVLVHRAVGEQLTCIFVDHGLLRKNEAAEVLKEYRDN